MIQYLRVTCFNNLEGDAAIRAVLEEQTAIDLTLVQVLRLVSAVHDIRGTRWLLELPSWNCPFPARLTESALVTAFRGSLLME